MVEVKHQGRASEDSVLVLVQLCFLSYHHLKSILHTLSLPGAPGRLPCHDGLTFLKL